MGRWSTTYYRIRRGGCSCCGREGWEAMQQQDDESI